jgi:hypothetical protein
MSSWILLAFLLFIWAVAIVSNTRALAKLDSLP